jgi:flagellar motor switch protein FliN/FliY
MSAGGTVQERMPMADEHPPIAPRSQYPHLAQVEQALATIERPSSGIPPELRRFHLAELTGAAPSTTPATPDDFSDLECDLAIEFGRTLMDIQDAIKLRAGSVVPLDTPEGSPVDVIVNGRRIAKGELLVLDGNFCVRVVELIASEFGG